MYKANKVSNVVLLLGFFHIYRQGYIHTSAHLCQTEQKVHLELNGDDAHLPASCVGCIG